MTDEPKIEVYEYAGFFYMVPEFEPVPGQHEAAWKDKHRRAAREMHEAEKNGPPSRI